VDRVAHHPRNDRAAVLGRRVPNATCSPRTAYGRGMTDSWRLKLLRAEKHLADLGDLFAPKPPTERYPYPCREVLKSEEESDYFMDLGIAVSPYFAIVAGDLLFNIRSALDHLICALIPDEDKGRAQFPIFTADPFEMNQRTGKPVRPEVLAAWERQTKGLPDPVIALLTLMQPYCLAREQGREARHFALAVLSALQNADKHRQLIFSKAGLTKVELIVNGITVDYVGPSLYDGKQMASLPPHMDVVTKGSVVIPLGIGDDVGYAYPDVFNLILNDVANLVLPPLEGQLGRPVEP